MTIAKDLASALFVMMLRFHLEASEPAEGLLRLLSQRMTGQAVLAMVRDPVRAWTLDELAHTAASSRATLVRAFRKASGVAPLAFLADLRLGLARYRLAGGAAIPVPGRFQSRLLAEIRQPARRCLLYATKRLGSDLEPGSPAMLGRVAQDAAGGLDR